MNLLFLKFSVTSPVFIFLEILRSCFPYTSSLFYFLIATVFVTSRWLADLRGSNIFVEGDILYHQDANSYTILASLLGKALRVSV